MTKLLIFERVRPHTEKQTVNHVWSDNSFPLVGSNSCDRVHDRYEWKHWIHVAWIRDSMIGQPIVVGTSDLSAGGIGMICPSMVHPGSIGLVIFYGANRQLKWHYVEVVHCRYLVGSMAHLVGARWIGEPAGMPEVRVEMTATGPRLDAGLIRGPRDVCRLRRPPTVVAGIPDSARPERPT